MKWAACVLTMGLLAAPAAADSFVDGVVNFLGQPDGSTLMLIHGDSATGVGGAYSYELASVDGWTLDLDVGIIQSNRGNVRLIPGVSVSPPVGGSVRPFIGVAATPDEYGQIRIGGCRTDAAIYGGFRKEF